MKTLIWLALLAGLVYWGWTLGLDQGALTLTWQGDEIQVPLSMAAGGALVALIGTMALIGLINLLLDVPHNLRRWWQRHQQRQAVLKTSQGFLALLEGRWSQAEKALLQSAPLVDNAWINYVSAAQAAQLEGAYNRRDEYLDRAEKKVPLRGRFALDILRARLYLEAGQYEQGLALASMLQARQPKHPRVLDLLQQGYVQTQAWDKLAPLLPTLAKYHLLTESEQSQLEARVFEGLWANKQMSWEESQALWRRLPKMKQQQPALLEPYVALLCEHQEQAQAERLLASAIHQAWDERLVARYGQILGADLKKQLATAEGWLKQYPESAVLLVTCGRLSLANQLWGKAQRYFESSLVLDPKAETYVLLGTLLDRLGKVEQGQEYFRQGLEISAALPGKD